MNRYVAAAAITAVMLVTGCDTDEPADGADQPDNPFAELEPQGPVQPAELREEDGVIDGDTFRAVGYDDTIRPLCIDTEEVLEGPELQEAKRDWDSYQTGKTEEADEPVSYGTLYGNKATDWAEEFFEKHGNEVWLEYESSKRTRGYFNRHLVYLWVREGGDGDWLNYNVEAARAGMTPYYKNFGRCAVYHDELLKAQQEAKDNERGVWAPDAPAYDDYDERMDQWVQRADQVDEFRARFSATPGVVKLGLDTAPSRLRTKVGQRAVVFGAVADARAEADPPRFDLYHRQDQRVRIEMDEGMTLQRFGDDITDADFVYALGEVGLYRGDPMVRVDTAGFVRPGDDPPGQELVR